MDMYLVWREEDGPEDGGVRIKAFDGEQAAEEWAERDDRDSAEYTIASGEEVTVVARNERDGRKTRYRVTGEAQPVYTAREVSGDE